MFIHSKIIPAGFIAATLVTGVFTGFVQAKANQSTADHTSPDGFWSIVTDHSQDWSFNPTRERYKLYQEPEASLQDPMEGLYLIMKHEGFSAKAYKCAGKKWTIGYGETAGVKPGDVISEPEARRRVKFLYLSIREEVRDLAPHASRLEVEAMTSFAYNVGLTAFKESTLLALVNSGQTVKASREFDRWINAGGKKQNGLVTRRDEEKALFRG